MSKAAQGFATKRTFRTSRK